MRGGGPVTGPPLTLVLLAAGLGSRFGGLKQLDPLGPGGSTLMDYSVFDAWSIGFRRAVFVIRPDMAEAFEQSLAAKYRARLEVATVFQRLGDLPAGFIPPPGRTRPWGTAQAVLAARSAVDGPFVVLNADDFYGRAALEAVATFLRRGAASLNRHAVVGYRLDATASPAGGVNRAILELGPGNTLARIVETKELAAQPDGSFVGVAGGKRMVCPAETPVSMNLWGFFPSCFPVLGDGFTRFLAQAPGLEEEYYLPEAVQEGIRAGRLEVDVIPAAGRWCGVTYAADRDWVREILDGLVAKGEYPEALWR